MNDVQMCFPDRFYSLHVCRSASFHDFSLRQKHNADKFPHLTVTKLAGAQVAAGEATQGRTRLNNGPYSGGVVTREMYVEPFCSCLCGTSPFPFSMNVIPILVPVLTLKLPDVPRSPRLRHAVVLKDTIMRIDLFCVSSLAPFPTRLISFLFVVFCVGCFFQSEYQVNSGGRQNPRRRLWPRVFERRCSVSARQDAQTKTLKRSEDVSEVSVESMGSIEANDCSESVSRG